MAKRLDCAMILLRVCNVPSTVYGEIEGRHPSIVADLIGGIKAEAQAYLEKKTAELRALGAEKVSHVLRVGLAADQIIELARQTPDHIVVMGSHGWSGVKRWLLGSVSETVARHSRDPVLVMRAPRAKTPPEAK